MKSWRELIADVEEASYNCALWSGDGYPNEERYQEAMANRDAAVAFLYEEIKKATGEE